MTPQSLPFASALDFALLHHSSNDIEGAPSFAVSPARQGWMRLTGQLSTVGATRIARKGDHS
jgi:hypothetical protein